VPGEVKIVVIINRKGKQLSTDCFNFKIIHIS
jgi:hypothetical protein